MIKMTVPNSLYTLLFFTFLVIQATSQSLPDKERATLLDLYSYWQSPPLLSHWNRSSSNSTSHCSWPEITCTNDSITALILVNVGLALEVPSFICDLGNLTHLDLGDNSLPGDFPLSIFNCSKLEYLDLSENYFVGSISDGIDRLPRLQTLILKGNNFSGDVPSSIGNLTELRELHLYRNQLNGSFPVELGNLENLELLWLSWLPKMAPWKIPFEFTKMKKLKVLWIREANLIGEMPQSVGELEALEELDLSNNQLTGKIPSGMFLLKHLSVVYLYKNKLSGEIPQVVEAFNLSIIDISNNSLSGSIPQGFENLTKLTDMSLFYNEGISGEIPQGIGLLPNLVIFKMFNMNLSGTIPSELGKHSPLEDFQVSVNRLTGKLPDGLCKNSKLVGVVAYENSLTGELPSSLENCDSLMIVTVYDNMLSGDIPSGMWKALNLSYVLMSNNSLTGELPEKMSNNLLRVEIRNNKFSGQIPRGLSSCKMLQYFDAANNLLNGTIPQELTTLSSLASLLLHQNHLSGKLPSVIASWDALNILDLSRNKLTGPIPDSLCVLPSLTELDLSENQLSGQIPNQPTISKLNTFNLSSNLLSGKIPSLFENALYNSSFLNNAGLCASVSGLNVNVCSSTSPSSSKSSNWSLALIISLSAALFLLVLFLLVLFLRGYLTTKEGSEEDWKLTPFQRCNFTSSKILSGLTESNVIGSGGSGKVYRVPVNRPGDVVAVKRIWTNKKITDDRLEKQFLAEVKILSSIRHANIVKLMCCISSKSSKLLVYEYSNNRSLDLWLHRRNRQSLSHVSSLVHHVVLDWRLQIAVGAAKGLCYMHQDCVPPVVHRDVKSSNILLDSDFNAKIADFGLTKMLVKQGDLATMSAVAGSIGYMAPEYAYTARVNEKIDVYCFGVILLELTTGRESNEGDGEHTSLAEWAWRHAQQGRPIHDAFDQDVKEPCYMDEMCAVFKLRIMCTEKQPSNRPCMKEVLHILVKTCPASPIQSEKTEKYSAAPLLKNSRRERILEDQNDLETNV